MATTISTTTTPAVGGRGGARATEPARLSQSERPGPWARSFWSVWLEGVLDLLARLLQVALGLVGLALGLPLLVVRGVAELLLAFALGGLSLVAELVHRAHAGVPPRLTAYQITMPARPGKNLTPGMV